MSAAPPGPSHPSPPGPSPFPAPRQERDAPARIRSARLTTGRRIAVLDDDPTGSQTVHGVSVVTVPEAPELAAALRRAGDTCFVLTNTRSLPEEEAARLTARTGRTLFALAEEEGYPLDVVSRSDSTLRGHVWAEVRALDGARREVTGRGYDGVLLAPGLFEAGRFTAGSVHWARVAGRVVPVGSTEFARDATFGYASSDLRAFVAEKSGGTITPGEVRAITLDDIRGGGPGRVAEILDRVTDGAFVVADGLEYADYDVVVLGLLQVEGEGRAFLCRTGPSFVRSLAGVEPRPPLTAADLWPGGSPGGHGLVVVGSHVGLTSRQVLAAEARGGLAVVELDVPTLMDAAARDPEVARVAARVAEALGASDVLLLTSRSVLRGGNADASLGIARAVSAAVVDVVRAALAARPSWVVAKGGITSHDVAVRGLGIRRAVVLGQLVPGVSVFRPVRAAPEALGLPYVVFPGNVGDEGALADVLAALRGDL